MASLIADLIKTPKQIREEQTEMLRKQGQALALRNKENAILPATSGLARLFGSMGTSTLEQLPQSMQNVASRGMLGLSSLFSAAGAPDAAEELRRASLSPEERKAEEEMKVVSKAGEGGLTNLRTAKKRAEELGLAKSNPKVLERINDEISRIEKLETKIESKGNYSVGGKTFLGGLNKDNQVVNLDTGEVVPNAVKGKAETPKEDVSLKFTGKQLDTTYEALNEKDRKSFESAAVEEDKYLGFIDVTDTEKAAYMKSEAYRIANELRRKEPQKYSDPKSALLAAMKIVKEQGMAKPEGPAAPASDATTDRFIIKATKQQ